MSARRTLIVLHVLALATACTSSDGEEAEPAPSKLAIETGIAWNVVMDPRFGTIAHAEPRDPGTSPIVLSQGQSPGDAALGFLERHASAFSLRAPRADLRLEAEGVDALGLRYASFVPADVPDEYASTRLAFHFDAAGRIAFAGGRYSATSAAASAPKTIVRRASARTCLRIDGSGNGVRFYAAPPLRNEADVKRFEVTARAGGGYEMKRPATASGAALSCTTFDGVPVTSPAIDVWDAVGSDAGAAVDAYFHAGKALEFYRVVLGRASYDDKNAPLTVVVHGEGGGAAYQGDGTLSFGAPRPNVPSPALSYAGAFDAVAHELQHAVTASTLLLQNGASDEDSHTAILDEALSDVFAAFAEHWLRPGDANLTVGEDVAAPGFPPTRDMLHPSRCLDVACVDDCGHRACPDHFSKLDVHADVHRSTGIASNAWALMTVGGANDTSGVRVDAPIGWEASQRLWYALVVSRGVAPNARFADVALSTVALARHAANGPIDVTAVACAWVAAGVIDARTASRFWDVTCRGG